MLSTAVRSLPACHRAVLLHVPSATIVLATSSGVATVAAAAVRRRYHNRPSSSAAAAGRPAPSAVPSPVPFTPAAPSSYSLPPFTPAFAPVVSRRVSFAHGDACSAASYRALLPPATNGAATPLVDLLLTDPPYCLLTPRGDAAVMREGTKRKKLLFDPSGASSSLRFATPRAYRDFTAAWLSAFAPHLSPDGVLVIWTNFLGKAPIAQAVSQVFGANMQLWNEMLWIKPSKPTKSTTPRAPVTHSISPATPAPVALEQPFDSALHSPLPLSHSLTSAELSFRCYETALIFGRGSLSASRFAASASREHVVVSPYVLGDDASSALAHPNAKSARVLRPLLDMYSQPNDLVLDPFAGSAAHALAALQAGRRVATMEANEVWARRMRDLLLSQPHSQQKDQ